MSSMRKSLIMIIAAVMCCMCMNKQIVYADKTSGEIEVIMTLSEDEMRPYLDEFENEYPNVKVKYTYYQNYEEELKKRMEEGSYGDVFFFPSFLYENEILTYLEPIDSLQTLSQKYNFMEQSRQIEGVVYGIPSYAYLCGIIYNKEVFDKAGITQLPKTTDEFLEAMRLIDIHTDAIPFYTNYNADFVLETWGCFPFIEMTGDAGYRYGEFLNHVNPFRKKTAHYEVYQLLYNMVEAGYVEEEQTKCDWDASKRMLNNGEIGCMAIGSWAVSQFKEAGSNPQNVGFMPFPNQIDGKQYMTVQTDYCYAISKNSKNKEAAKAYVEFMIERSGFALDHENLSIVKTDVYPDTYDLNDNVILLTNDVATGESYQLFTSLQKDLNLFSASEIRRIIDAASGKEKESFNDIMNDWNRRWEACRPEGLKANINKTEEQLENSVFDNSKVQFSDTEEKYLLDNPAIRVGFHQNMAPLSYEMQGAFCGAAYEMCNIIARNTNLDITYIGYPNTNELIQALQRGEIDMAAGIEKTTEYEGLIKYSKDYFEYYNVLIENEKMATAELADRLAAIPTGEVNSYWSNMEKTGNYTSIGECVEAVEKLKADYTITNYYSANYYTREKECEKVSVIPYVGSGSLHLGFAANADAAFVAICNKCIYSIADGEMEVALMKYMDPPAKEMTLKRFVEAHTMLCFAVVFGFFFVVLAAILLILLEKNKSNKKHALEVKKYELLASLADEYMFEYDCEKNEIVFNDKYETAFGFGGTIKRKEIPNTNPALKQLLERLDKIMDCEEEGVKNFCMEKVNGEKTWYRLITSQITEKDGKTVHILGKLLNVQKEMEQMQNFQNKAERDPLTQLYNREGFYQRLPEKAGQILFAVLDFDRFKSVNDTLGHMGGDYCLVLLSQKLVSAMGENAIVGRYGGDEFVVAVQGISQEEGRKWLEQLVHSMNMEVNYQENKIKLSISVGAVYSRMTINTNTLFAAADEALYHTKKAGRNGYYLETLD